MEYSVPQFIDVEDKIIAFLTLKQFLTLLPGGLLGFFYWSLFGGGIIFYILTIATFGILAMIAFVKFNGRPLLAAGPNLMKFYVSPKIRVFRRMEDHSPVVKKQTPIAEKYQNREAAEPSRLKKLAYMLDQKAAEEERLIHSSK